MGLFFDIWYYRVESSIAVEISIAVYAVIRKNCCFGEQNGDEIVPSTGDFYDTLKYNFLRFQCQNTS